MTAERSPHSVQDDLNLVRQELGIDAGLIADNDVRAAFERLEEHIENFRIHVEREIEPGLVEQLEALRDALDEVMPESHPLTCAVYLPQAECDCGYSLALAALDGSSPASRPPS